MAGNFPSNPSNGDTYAGFTYNSTLGAWRAPAAATTNQLDGYLQVANSTSFATTSQLDGYLQVANSTSFATTSQLDGYLQVANSTSLSYASEKTFSVTNSGSGAYVFSGVGTGESSANSNPTLYLTRGETYKFSVNASGHPFYINTTNATGTGNAFANGVNNNGAAVGDVTFTVPMNAPSRLHYNCQYHSSMNGPIYILSENSPSVVYALSGVDINPNNGGIQTKTVSSNTTFTESLSSGDSVVMHLNAGASYTVTWPTIKWASNTSPTLTAADVLVFWKVSSTLYGAYVGSYV